MATRTVCDGCGDEIKPWMPNGSGGDGLQRRVQLITGNNSWPWDLCDPCQGKVANALAELLPCTPRESWWPAIRPSKTR